MHQKQGFLTRYAIVKLVHSLFVSAAIGGVLFYGANQIYTPEAFLVRYWEIDPTLFEFCRYTAFLLGTTLFGVLVGHTLATTFKPLFFHTFNNYQAGLNLRLVHFRRQQKWPGRRLLESLRYTKLADIRREFLTLGLDGQVPIPRPEDVDLIERITAVLGSLEDELEQQDEKELQQIVHEMRSLVYRFAHSYNYRQLLDLTYTLGVPALVLWFIPPLMMGPLHTLFPNLGSLEPAQMILRSSLLLLLSPTIIYVTGKVLYLLTWNLGKRSETQVDDILWILFSWGVAGLVGLVMVSLTFSMEAWPLPFQEFWNTVVVLVAPTKLCDDTLMGTFLPHDLSNMQLFGLRAFVVLWVSGMLIQMLHSFCVKVFRQIAARTQQKQDDMAVEIIRIFGTFILGAMGFGWLLLVFFAQFGEVVTAISLGDGSNALMPYAILVAVTGAILGVGSKDLLENFFAGISLQIDKPFEKGERIVLENGEVCEVRTVGMRSTHFYNITENSDLFIPNTELSRQTVTNLSRPDRQFRRSISYFIRDDKPESLLLAESLMILAAFSVEGVDIPTIVDQETEKSQFHKNRKGIVPEFQTLQARFDEITNARIKFQGQLRSVNEIVATTSYRISNNVQILNKKKRERRWDSNTGRPKLNFLSSQERVELAQTDAGKLRVAQDQQLREEILKEADMARETGHNFYRLAMCFYTLSASYPAIRPDLEHLHLEILRAPSTRSKQVLTEDGQSIWEVELLAYAQLTEQSDEIIHHLNTLIQQLLTAFELSPTGPGGGVDAYPTFQAGLDMRKEGENNV
ncbi:mechanosensitive ion channel domain-containing protein [Magnetococcus sp. PR-3]|uniref:mechanosensitive ion channel domain-containing protein n=1 Tax=Magnetococcus sp. PR-3 TaxID=3120355 RepID=UPI002FCE1CA2